MQCLPHGKGIERILYSGKSSPEKIYSSSIPLSHGISLFNRHHAMQGAAGLLAPGRHRAAAFGERQGVMGPHP